MFFFHQSWSEFKTLLRCSDGQITVQTLASKQFFIFADGQLNVQINVQISVQFMFRWAAKIRPIFMFRWTIYWQIMACEHGFRYFYWCSHDNFQIAIFSVNLGMWTISCKKECHLLKKVIKVKLLYENLVCRFLSHMTLNNCENVQILRL